MIKMTYSWLISLIMPVVSVFVIMISMQSGLEAEGNDNTITLLDAALNKDVAAVRRLIEQGANVNEKDSYGHTPLMAAFKSLELSETDIEIAKLLMAHGADVNSRLDEDATPLHITAMKGKTEFAAWLISKGADINAIIRFDRERGTTPLHAAVAAHQYKMVKLLIRKGADKNAQTLSGSTKNMTPLHMAAAYEFTDIVTFLIKNKAAVNKKDMEGRTALDYARENKNKYIMRILKKHGAKSGKDIL